MYHNKHKKNQFHIKQIYNRSDTGMLPWKSESAHLPVFLPFRSELAEVAAIVSAIPAILLHSEPTLCKYLFGKSIFLS
jgi:hypothetical protein